MADFCFALRLLKKADAVRRQSWREGLFVSKPAKLLVAVYEPHLCLMDARHPDALASHWLPGYDDLIADDWEAIERKADVDAIENY